MQLQDGSKRFISRGEPQTRQQQEREYWANNTQQIETINEAIVEYENAYRQTTDATSDTIIVDSSQSMSEQERGRRFVISNNAAIATDNSLQMLGDDDEKAVEGRFNFFDSAARTDAPEGEPATAAAKEKSAGRSDLKQQLMEQSLVQEEFQNRALAQEEAKRRLQERMSELDAEMAQQEAQQQMFGQPQQGGRGIGGFGGGIGGRTRARTRPQHPLPPGELRQQPALSNLSSRRRPICPTASRR